MHGGKLRKICDTFINVTIQLVVAYNPRKIILCFVREGEKNQGCFEKINIGLIQ